MNFVNKGAQRNGKTYEKKESKRDDTGEKSEKNYKRQNKSIRTRKLSYGITQVAGGIAGPAKQGSLAKVSGVGVVGWIFLFNRVEFPTLT